MASNYWRDSQQINQCSAWNTIPILNLLDPGNVLLNAGKMPMPILKTRNDKILFWNCASGFFNKKPFVEEYILQKKPALFFISECNIAQGHMLELMNVPGYLIEVSGTLKTRNKGRIMVYVKSGSGYSRKAELEDDTNEVPGAYCGWSLCWIQNLWW